MAAIYFWFPKVAGKMYNEKLGKLHFWLMFPAFFLQSFGQMYLGPLGMRRRIADWDPSMGFGFTQLLITIAGFLIFISMVIFVANLITSARKGTIAIPNPWRSRSPEWRLPTPIPVHNYRDHPIEVIGEPYDYGLAGSTYIREVQVEAAQASD